MLLAYVLILGHSIVPHEHTALFDKDGHHHQHEHHHAGDHHEHQEGNPNEADPLSAWFGHFPHSHYVHTQEHVVAASDEFHFLKDYTSFFTRSSVPQEVVATCYDPPDLPRPPEVSTLDAVLFSSCRRGPPAC